MTTKHKQRLLFDGDSATSGTNGTFSPNHRQSIHRWYPYLEGYSSEFVRGLLDEFATDRARVYDPFAGTGTTVTTAAFRGCLPYYSEINPVMRLIIECKTNGLRIVARKHRLLRDYFERLLQLAEKEQPTSKNAAVELQKAFGAREYFVGSRLVEIVSLKHAISKCATDSPAFRDMARMVLAAIAVGSSEMKRAADLRYRHPKELLPDDFSPLNAFRHKYEQVLLDIDGSFADLPAAECLCHSALDQPGRDNFIDLLITSPPYVNGTNYFRNTKLELWLTGLLESEVELAGFTDVALAAGINNISQRGRSPVLIPQVEEVAAKLDQVAYDKRIPELIRRYFSDSLVWIRNSFQILRPGGFALIDIGDSRYAGIHVPADVLLQSIASDVGFELVDTRLVRSRKAKDGGAVKQVLLVLKKPCVNGHSHSLPLKATRDEFLNAAVEFGRELPHLASPYSSRNWGHGLHSLCSYQGKLKPAIAHFLVSRFTEPGQCILDPLSGCGTIPLEAFLQGRFALGNDLQELAYILTRAKTEWGSEVEADRVASTLLDYVSATRESVDDSLYDEFGFNGPLPEYFHNRTYREILAARRFMKLNPCDSWPQAVVYSAMLHILHGNRPYALSRRSHPVTPFKPTGEASYRPLKPRLLDKVRRTLALAVPVATIKGVAHLGDFSTIPYRHSVDAIITSPPFAASTRFFSTNWMRLWMAGWEPEDFASRREAFIERQQASSLDVYHLFFERCIQWLRPGGRLIMHLGKTAKCDMAKELTARIPKDFEVVYQCDEDVAGREKFGLRDQGATTSHQYIFIRLR